MASREVDDALSLIESLKLTLTSGALLAAFVTEALHPVLAARYVMEGLGTPDASSFLEAWTYIVEAILHGCSPPPLDAATRKDVARRDGGRCCITGRPGTLWDPLKVVPILPVPAGWITGKPRVWDMLGSFFGPSYRDWWISYTQHPELMEGHHSHWLVRKSAADTFSRGLVWLNRQQPSMVECEVEHVLTGPEEPIRIDGHYALLGDHSRSGTAKVNARFVGSHARFSKSIRLLVVAKDIALCSSPSPTPSITFNEISPATADTTKMLHGCKPAAYKALRTFGEHLYGKPDGHAPVQRLPFNLYLKYQGGLDDLRNEFNALQVVRLHTPVPIPKPIDIVAEHDTNEDDPSSSPNAYLLMARLPGLPLSRCQDVISDPDYESIALQMASMLTHLRGIPKTASPDMAICNTLGGACMDPRIMGGQAAGPFVDETAFSQVLRFSDEPSRRGHKIVFTHADLNPRNILVDRVVRADGSRGWAVSGSWTSRSEAGSRVMACEIDAEMTKLLCAITAALVPAA